MTDNRDMVRAHNDAFRSTFSGGRVYATRGITKLPKSVAEGILKQVRTYDEFTEDNDPHGEHDFGSFEDEDAGKIFWKIDCYDQSMEMHSPDPSDPSVTNRVPTIMLANEY